MEPEGQRTGQCPLSIPRLSEGGVPGQTAFSGQLTASALFFLTLFHFPDVNKRAGIFAGEEVKYLQAFSAATFCPSLLPGGYARFTHPYTVLVHGRGTSVPAQLLHLPVMCFTPDWKVTSQKCFIPHLNIGRGAEKCPGRLSSSPQHSS